MTDLQGLDRQMQEPLGFSLADHSSTADELHDLANQHFIEYEKTGAISDLDAAIQRFQEALDLTSADQLSDRITRLYELGMGYFDKHERTEIMEDLDIGIQKFQEALDLTPTEQSLDRADLFDRLASGYFVKYEKTRAMRDLELSIQHGQETSDLTPADFSSNQWPKLGFLALAYNQKYSKTGAIADLDISIERFEEALDLSITASLSERARLLFLLGTQYFKKFEETQKITDVDNVIRRYQEAFNLMSTDNFSHSQVPLLFQLGAAYYARFGETGVITDLENAIQQYQAVLELTSTNDLIFDRAELLLLKLGLAYHEKYYKTKIIRDLELAIQYYQKILNISSIDKNLGRTLWSACEKRPELRADIISLIGHGYEEKYHHTGVMSDLDISLERSQEALDLLSTEASEQSDQAYRLETLAVGHWKRFEKIQGMTDLEIALRRSQEALDVTSINDPKQASRYEILGNFYLDKYLRTGTRSDFELSLQNFHKALDLTPINHSDRAGLFHNFGKAYLSKYFKTNELIDLNNCIERYQEALDLTSTDDTAWCDRLQYLADAYQVKYGPTGTLQAFEIALDQAQQTLSLPFENNSRRAFQLEFFGLIYINKYLNTEILEDLEIAIQHQEEAKNLTPTLDSNRARQLRSLGFVYFEKYQITNAEADLEIAIQRFEEGLDHLSSSIKHRLDCGKYLFKLHAMMENWPEAYQAAIQTVSLVAQLTPNSLETSDKQHLLTDYAELASNASAVALNASKNSFDAVQILELGRGLITGSLNEIRMDVSDLQQKHSQLAKEYIALRDQLDISSVSTEFHINQRHNASQGLERKIQEIRLLPDFDRFLLASSEDELKSAAEYGPIVIVNVSGFRCDALIIEKVRIRVLPLPHLQASDIQNHIKEFTETLATPEILKWLWDAVAQPVLTELGFVQTPSDDCWPHMWWIPAGRLAKFPIHAAGCQSEGSSNNVFDRVISSYSSSVKALIHSRRHRPHITKMSRSENVVLVAMEKTPNKASLHFATQEVDELTKLCSSMNLQAKQPLPYTKSVLSALNDCKIFHFAGHGLTDNLDPSKSQLLLKDWETEPLTVKKLFETNLRKNMPFLAYLSACGTGQIKHNKLIDESLHLISACQLAGFQHVIGTLWKVNDKSCVNVAIKTYEWMRDHGMSDESVSEGLHHAVRCLRREWIKENTTRGAFKNDRELRLTRSSRTALDQSFSSLGEAQDIRDAGFDDDKILSPLYWVPYVHYGV